MDQTETEMGQAPKVETEAIYAWALDDGVDDLPTQRLTPRRITALGIAASLVVIAVSGAVALLVIHNVNHPVAQARSSPIVEAVARPAPPPTVTVTAAAPTAPLPSPAPSNNAANEASFVSAVFATIPTFTIPGGRPTDAQLIAAGYRACLVMDQDRSKPIPVTAYTFYQQEGFNMSVMEPAHAQQMWDFMDYATTLLCPRNAVISPVVVPPSAVKSTQAGCTEGATRVQQGGEGDPETCENGKWHEGPYGYGGGG
jgi:hypothetical protein